MVFTADNFEAEVLGSTLPVVVDFYADWCGPCKMMAPAVAAMEELFRGKVKIGKLNVDQAPNIAEKYNVMSIPTLLFFRDGKVVETSIGLIPKESLQEKVEALVR
jgi:thioredoxin 1